MTPLELIAWRDQHDISQGVLAELLGVDAVTISRWERGARQIPPFLHLALKAIEDMPRPGRRRPRPRRRTGSNAFIPPVDADTLQFLDRIDAVFDAAPAQGQEVTVERSQAQEQPTRPAPPDLGDWHRPAPFHSVRGHRCSCGATVPSTESD